VMPPLPLLAPPAPWPAITQKLLIGSRLRPRRNLEFRGLRAAMGLGDQYRYNAGYLAKAWSGCNSLGASL
jgi:hypothetical protein